MIKNDNKNKIFYIISLSILIIIIPIYIFSNYSSILLYRYIYNNSKDINSGLLLSSTDFQNTQLFIVGERPGYAYNNEVKYEMISYLVKYANLKYIVYEGYILTAMIFNHYIQTGDDKLLKKHYSLLMKKNDKYSLKVNDEEYSFLKKLRILNQSLSDEKKIQIICFDYNFMLISKNIIKDLNIFDILFFLLPNEDPPNQIIEVVNKLKKFSTNIDFFYDQKERININKSLEENKKTWKLYLGQYYDFFITTSFILNNVFEQYYNSAELPEFSIEKYSSKRQQFYELRDYVLYINLKRILEKENESILVWYDSNHISSISRKPNDKRENWLSDYVKKDSLFEGKYAIFILLYFNSIDNYSLQLLDNNREDLIIKPTEAEMNMKKIFKYFIKTDFILLNMKKWKNISKVRDQFEYNFYNADFYICIKNSKKFHSINWE